MGIMESKNDRYCIYCREPFSPYSMVPSHQPPVAPGVGYVCITCRSKKESK